MIRRFKCRETARLFHDSISAKYRQIERAARRKLEMLDAATSMLDLVNPPGNRLEALKGDRLGQHSIRINDQYRLCFRWKDDGAFDVEIVDYHRG